MAELNITSYTRNQTISIRFIYHGEHQLENNTDAVAYQTITFLFIYDWFRAYTRMKNTSMPELDVIHDDNWLQSLPTDT